MAGIDDLLEQVSDNALRSQLQQSVRDLRRRKKFGLVFEQHIPETVLLSAAGIHVGSQVMLRREPNTSTRFLVTDIRDGVVTLRDGDSSREAAIDDLLVIKPFGEPVYPFLSRQGCLTQQAGKPYHSVINGENFHALELLLFSCAGKVDCIYIDPPYNTGARDWKYNNNYVDDQDAWRHSKWLSFMEKRLRLAKKLLKPDSVLIITIDENELHHIGVLLEELFPDARRQLVTICINPGGASGGDGLSRVEEYAFFCFFGGAQPHATDDDMLVSGADEDAPHTGARGVRWEWLMRGGNAWYRASRVNLCYPIVLNEDATQIVGTGEPLVGNEGDRLATLDGLPLAWPVRRDGKLGIWRVEAARLKWLAKRGYAFVSAKDSARGTWTIKYLLSGTVESIDCGAIDVVGRGDRGEVLVAVKEQRGKIAKTMWNRGRHIAGGGGGTHLLNALLGERNLFPFPKSVYAVRDCLQVATGDMPNALVLDFFAGSGTTLNATSLLNSMDGGSRRCVLVSNNEVEEKTARALNTKGLFFGDPEFEQNGICRAVTVPRVRAALTGVQPSGQPVEGSYTDGHNYADGFGENAVFFDLAYGDPDALETGTHFDDIVPLLWLAAGCQGNPDQLDVADDWLMPEESPFAVLLDEDRLRAFLSALERRPDITHVWIVTDSENAFARMRSRIPGGRSVGMLYRDYLRNFIINAQQVAR